MHGFSHRNFRVMVTPGEGKRKEGRR